MPRCSLPTASCWRLRPVPWVGGKVNPSSPGGWGHSPRGGPTAKWQPALSSWAMERMRRCRRPPAHCSFLSPGRRKSITGDVPRQAGAAGRAEAVIRVLFIKGLFFKSDQSTATCKLSPTEMGVGRFKLLCRPSWRKPVLSTAQLLAILPGIKFISKLINKIRSRLFHKLRASPCCRMGSLSRISFATSLTVSKVTRHCGLCSLPRASQITHKLFSVLPKGPRARLRGHALELFPSLLGCWILHDSHKALRASRPRTNVISSCPWSYGHGELVSMHVSTSPAPGPPWLCPWGGMGTPCSGCTDAGGG